MDRTRLVLVVPATGPEPVDAARLEAALAGGDVAAVVIDAGDVDAGDNVQPAVAALVDSAQKAGAAALIRGDSRLVGRTHADGVHVDESLDEIEAALERFHPNGIVGAGGAETRHDAMLIAESGPDYIFFGDIDAPEAAETNPRDFEFGTWWAEVFEIPVVVLVGLDMADVPDLAAAGVEFVAMRGAVWNNADGPAAAVARANELIDQGMAVT
tara:strand:- start:402 stop:1040 length:639 start_codon:yes stop_codon:yes gene_type:complete